MSLLEQYLASLRESTATKQRGVLEECAALLSFGSDAHTIDWSSISVGDLERMQQKLLLYNKPNTVRTKVAIVRSLLRRYFAAGMIEPHVYEGYLLLKTLPPNSRSANGRMVTSEEWARIWAVLCPDTPIGRFEMAVLFTLATTGMRVGELIAVRRDDYDPPVIRIEHTKTYRPRDVRVSRTLHSMLEKHMTDHDSPTMFAGVGDHRTKGPLTRDRVAWALESICKRADLKNITPHDLRRTTASTLLANGVDVVTVADVLGHRNVNTTRMYDRRSEERKAESFNTLSDVIIGEGENGRQRERRGREGSSFPNEGTGTKSRGHRVKRRGPRSTGTVGRDDRGNSGCRGRRDQDLAPSDERVRWH